MGKSYKKYLASDSWRCSESPVGAHYWVQKDLNKRGMYTCIHCDKAKRFANLFKVGGYNV